MVVKKPALKKKRKVRKGITTKTQTKKGKGGNVSQVVNVYVSKANRQRRASAPKQFTPAIQPQMFNAGQDFMITGLRQQNKTLMDILNKQRTADTSPNSDITSIDNLIRVKKLNTSTPKDLPKRDDEVDYGGIAPINPKYTTPTTQSNIKLDTTREKNVSNMLSSIASGMDEIPQGQNIKQRILEIKEQVAPSGVRSRIATIDELSEIGRLEIEYDNLVKLLQQQKRYDNTIKMSDYTQRLPKKVSKIKEKIKEMNNILDRSIENIGTQSI